MSSTRTIRILKVAAGVLSALFLIYVGLVALAVWEYRDHIYTIRDAPNAFTDDAGILRLSASALRLHGADPAAYESTHRDGRIWISRNELDPNRATTYWNPQSPNLPGYGVTLEQSGSDVVCHVSLLK